MKPLLQQRLAVLLVAALAIGSAGCTAMLLVGNHAHAGTGNGASGAQPAQSDSALTVQLRNALAASESVDATGIQVQVNRGVVILSGSVPSEDDAEEAERIADSLQGVDLVRNNLTVAGATASRH